LHGAQCFLVVDLLVLGVAALARSLLDEDQLARGVERGAGRADHVVEPVGVLGGGPFVGAFVLGDVEGVFITVDHEWYFGDVAVVDAVAGDAPFGGPAAQVSGELA